MIFHATTKNKLNRRYCKEVKHKNVLPKEYIAVMYSYKICTKSYSKNTTTIAVIYANRPH